MKQWSIIKKLCNNNRKRKILLKEDRGQITVLLTLLISVLLLLFFVTFEIIRYEQAKGRVQQGAVGVVENLMADFQVEMANWYHIYTIDENYLGRGRDVLDNRAWDYLENNLSGTSSNGDSHGIYQFTVADVGVEAIEYIGDNGCQILKKQIHNWIQDTSISNYKRVIRQEQANNHLVNKQYYQDMNHYHNEERNIAQEDISVLDTIDPRRIIDQIKHLGILTVASNDNLPLSKINHPLNNVPSHTLQWMPETKNLLTGIKTKVEAETYLFQHFNSALSVIGEHNTVFENEIEYCITGKQSDYDCLEKVSKKIVGIRFPINAAYLAKDSAKKEEAMAAAATIAAITFQPEATKAIQKTILAAWAYGESVADVKCLLAGEKIPKTKNKKSWKLSFSQLFQLKNAVVTEEKEGEDYNDYLKLLLIAVPEKTLYFRMLDLMQLNIAEKYPSFQIRECIASYQVLARIQMNVKFFPLPVKKGSYYEFIINKVGSYE